MSSLTGTCCLVTGGAGFIGSAIVDHLVAAGASEIRVLDNLVRGQWSNLSEAITTGRVIPTEGDIRDTALVDELTRGTDYVFHQAALRITRCAEAPREAIEVLVDGSFNVFEAAIRHKVKKVVAASSASVYGDPSYLPMDEAHPFNNCTLYGAGKIACEQILRALNNTARLQYTALRYFNVYGPRMDVTGVYTEVLVRWLDAIDDNRAPLIFGDGTQSMDFVYVDDVARANILAAESSCNDALNVGTGVQTSLNELCELLLTLTGSELKPEHRDARAVAHVKARRAATERAAKQIGFRSRVALRQGLRELIGWRQVVRDNVASAVEAL